MKKYLPLIIRSALVIFLIILLIVLSILKNNPEVCEAMTRGFSRFFGGIISKVTSFIPFSLTELTFVVMGLGIVALLVFAIIDLVKKSFQASLCRVIEIASIILLSVNVYHLSCEFAYKRKAIPLPYYEELVENDKLPAIYNYFIDDINACINSLEFEDSGDVKTSLSIKEISEEVIKAYSIIEGNDYYASYFGGAKPMLSSFIYREFQITGVTYSPLMEANINTLNTKSDLPLTIAHELAHTKGVMREDDANKLAFYICLNSDNPYLRYSAYCSYLYQLTSIASTDYLEQETIDNLHKMNGAIFKTRDYARKYWEEHDLLGDIGDFFNDLYIKMSGVEEGTTSYYNGTEVEQDPETMQLIPSPYQKLLFEKYYRP